MGKKCTNDWTAEEMALSDKIVNEGMDLDVGNYHLAIFKLAEAYHEIDKLRMDRDQRTEMDDQKENL